MGTNIQNCFRIASSNDGMQWHSDPSKDCDNSWHAVRAARAQSKSSGKFERVINTELDRILITFRDGVSVQIADEDLRPIPARRLVSKDLEDLFVSIININSDCYLRSWFEEFGVLSTEQRLLPQTGRDMPRETLPVPERVRHYFATVNWSDRRDVAKIFTIVNRFLRNSRHIQSIELPDKLAVEGLRFDGKTLVKL